MLVNFLPHVSMGRTRLETQRRRWNALYGKLARLPTVRDGHVNFPEGLGRLTRVRPFTSYRQSIGFQAVRCKRNDTRKLVVKAGGCRVHWRRTRRLLSRQDPGRYKVFVRGYRDLYDYGQAIKRGEVTRGMHEELYGAIRAQQRALEAATGKRATIINHNEDVPVLHFKFACDGDRTCGHERRSA